MNLPHRSPAHDSSTAQHTARMPSPFEAPSAAGPLPPPAKAAFNAQSSLKMPSPFEAAPVCKDVSGALQPCPAMLPLLNFRGDVRKSTSQVLVAVSDFCMTSGSETQHMDTMLVVRMCK